MANAVVLWVIVYFCVTSVNTKDTVVLIVLALQPHLEFDNFFRRLFRMATFIFVLCMCCLYLRVLPKVTPMYFGWGVFSRSIPFDF